MKPVLKSHSFLKHRRYITEHVIFFLFKIAALINGLILGVIVYFITVNGWRAINWTFLSQPPMDSMTKGGILPCIIGTLCLSLGSIIISFPIGVASAIYLNEYAQQGRILRIIRLCINNLAGVPSVVFGLFGLAFFVTWCNFKVSILSGALTLGLMSLPVIIGSAEEAFKSVPNTYREASLALGATKFQTIFKVVLPTALPGILTGGILAVSRVAGETAPIMFTAAVFFTIDMPSSIFDKVMALPYHIYVLATAGTQIETTRPLQYGTALVLIVLVLGMNLFAIVYRSRLRKRMYQ
ncbi:MAG: phosphate ABC transporter permease PstA [Desulfobacterales bacterium]|nr:phosphate ABC transporter permease PstA [Desulfobacterales bacterium]